MLTEYFLMPPAPITGWTRTKGVKYAFCDSPAIASARGHTRCVRVTAPNHVFREAAKFRPPV